MNPRLEQQFDRRASGMDRSRVRTLPARSSELIASYEAVRQFTDKLCEPLAPEDYVIQSMPDVSPTKWHLAHTSWFFETFVLKPFLPRYTSAVPEYGYLFNSYYNAAGPMHCRDRRGVISRPTAQETYRYREKIDRSIVDLLESREGPGLQKVESLIMLGLHHEQQHQELLLTDIKHVFAQNPLYPVYREHRPFHHPSQVPPLEWVEFAEGVYWIGHDGEGFSFDNERPLHRQFVAPFAIGSRLVTNGEYLAFMEAGGYARPEFWLSMGWQAVQQQRWRAPLYWSKFEGAWHSFTLAGLRPLDLTEPVCHVSYFEADAYARWAGARLPTEAEWEVAASSLPIDGNFVEDGFYQPITCEEPPASEELQQMFGDVWEWTRSAYSPYPGFCPAPGALGEYNGKFMCGQMVLRGGSCATSKSHIRPTYRNFFPPDKRWQFSGIRLARDAA